MKAAINKTANTTCELSTTMSNVDAPRNLRVQKIGCYKVESAFCTSASNFECCYLAYPDLIRNEFNATIK